MSQRLHQVYKYNELFRNMYTAIILHLCYWVGHCVRQYVYRTNLLHLCNRKVLVGVSKRIKIYVCDPGKVSVAVSGEFFNSELKRSTYRYIHPIVLQTWSEHHVSLIEADLFILN